MADDVADVAVHARPRGEVGRHIPILRLIVGVARDVVHIAVRVAENGALPRSEGGHPRPRRAADDELQVRIDTTHRLRSARGEPAILIGGHRTELPRAIEFIAEAPHADIKRSLAPVLLTKPRPLRAPGNVRVLEEVEGLENAPRSEVHCEHHLSVDLLDPAHKLVKAEGICLDAVPRDIKSSWTRLARPYPVFPPES